MEIEESKIESILSKYKKIREQILAEPEINSDNIDSFHLPTDYNKLYFSDDKFALKSSDSQKSIATFSNGISSKLVLKTPEFTQLSRDVEHNLVENHLKIEHLENCLNLQKNANQDKFNNIIEHYDNILCTAGNLRSQIETENNQMNCAFDKIKEDISNIQNDLNTDFNNDFEKLMKNFDSLPKLNETNDKINLEKIFENRLKNVKFQLPDDPDEINNFNSHNMTKENLTIPASIQSILKTSVKNYSFTSSIEEVKNLPLREDNKLNYIDECEKNDDNGPDVIKNANDLIESDVKLQSGKNALSLLEKRDIVNEISLKYLKVHNTNVKNRKNVKTTKVNFRK